MKVLKIAALAVFTAGSPIALWIGVRNMPAVQAASPPSAIELISTLFAAVTIILGVLAIIIAGLAIWGYAAIKDESQRAATTAAHAAVGSYLQGVEIQNQMRAESRKIIDDEIKKVREGLALGESQPQSTGEGPAPDDAQSVGERYPDRKEG